jgi:hypothetical protein
MIECRQASSGACPQTVVRKCRPKGWRAGRDQCPVRPWHAADRGHRHSANLGNPAAEVIAALYDLAGEGHVGRDVLETCSVASRPTEVEGASMSICTSAETTQLSSQGLVRKGASERRGGNDFGSEPDAKTNGMPWVSKRSARGTDDSPYKPRFVMAASGSLIQERLIFSSRHKVSLFADCARLS